MSKLNGKKPPHAGRSPASKLVAGSAGPTVTEMFRTDAGHSPVASAKDRTSIKHSQKKR